uniref:KH domain-containing protein n=1 Tax=Macrostomum lignano TaxID=282301 RepID=A0A1I8GFL6_9PLAT
MSVAIAESSLANSMQSVSGSSNHMNPQSSSMLPHMHHSPGGSSQSSLSTLATAANISLPKITPEYLQELLKDKKNLQSLPNLFNHLDKILETEITRVRSQLFHFNGAKRASDDLPEGEGPIVTVQEKVFIPVKDNPSYNFVGRLLGPRGMTAKQLETDLDCKIMVRGKGSMRDKKKEDQNRGKPNWEHLAEELHVLICVEDHQNRAEMKAKRAAEEIKAFLEQAVKMPDGEDDLKKKQLMELAIINGTYRDTSKKGGGGGGSSSSAGGQSAAAGGDNPAAAAAAAASLHSTASLALRKRCMQDPLPVFLFSNLSMCCPMRLPDCYKCMLCTLLHLRKPV